MSIRPILAATLVACVSFGIEVFALAAPEPEPVYARGELHQRAVVRYNLRQRALRDSIVAIAQAQFGIPYVLGGISPTQGFDCSGLVKFVYSQVLLAPPRRAIEQARIGAPIEATRLRPGDLLAFGKDSVTHVGIYIGNDRFVHASSVAGRVIVSPMRRPRSHLIRPLAGARRVLTLAGSDARIGG